MVARKAAVSEIMTGGRGKTGTGGLCTALGKGMRGGAKITVGETTTAMVIELVYGLCRGYRGGPSTSFGGASSTVGGGLRTTTRPRNEVGRGGG